MAERAVDLLMFYPAIVAGNFIGCNVYRLVETRQKSESEETVRTGNAGG